MEMGNHFQWDLNKVQSWRKSKEASSSSSIAGLFMFSFIKQIVLSQHHYKLSGHKRGSPHFWMWRNLLDRLEFEVRFALITSDIVRQSHRNLLGGDYDALSMPRFQANHRVMINQFFAFLLKIYRKKRARILLFSYLCKRINISPEETTMLICFPIMCFSGSRRGGHDRCCRDRSGRWKRGRSGW